VNEAKLDLQKRGFVVNGLWLELRNMSSEISKKQVCTKTTLECKCEYHGIFVILNLSL